MFILCLCLVFFAKLLFFIYSSLVDSDLDNDDDDDGSGGGDDKKISCVVYNIVTFNLHEIIMKSWISHV